MNATILEHRRQLETIRRNKAEQEKQVNKFIGIAVMVIVTTIAVLYFLDGLGIIHLSV